MAGQHPDQPNHDGSSHSRSHDSQGNITRQIETAQADDREAWANWVYPPEFYDGLSELHLTEGALAELDRRNRLLTQHHPRPSRPQATVSDLLRALPRKKDLGRFARLGGPDLEEIRNCPPPSILGTDEPLSSQTTTATMVKDMRKKSTPYDRNFEQHLKDHNVQASYDSQTPTNLAEIRAALNKRRSSLSLSQFSEGAFATFQNNNYRVDSEDTVMADVIPVILGESALIADRQASERNLLFNNIAPLTGAAIAQPRPDIYYGVRPEELSWPVRDALGRYIIPSTAQNKPLAANFFVEVKGPGGSTAVANRQARYDGAVGSRAMHALQNYGEKEPTYDGQAYSFSSTYHDGTLKLFAHHVAPPKNDGQPLYCMTQLRSISLIDSWEACVEGVAAFRNARDLAKEYRDGFIRKANERGTSQSSGILETIEEAGEQDSREGEKADTAQEPKTALANESPVALPTSSVARKGTKRKRPSPAPDVSVPLTRAAAKRLLSTSGAV